VMLRWPPDGTPDKRAPRLGGKDVAARGGDAKSGWEFLKFGNMGFHLRLNATSCADYGF
jgi:hypothetical protein